MPMYKTDQNTTPEENYDDWVNIKLCDDKYVSSYSDDILSKPRFFLSSTTSEFDKQPLYSEQQMLEMFRLGFMSMSKTGFGRKALANANRKRSVPGPYPTLRQLHIGGKALFPYSSWATVRVAAAKLKAEFGSQFRVCKLAPPGRIGDIEVLRVS